MTHLVLVTCIKCIMMIMVSVMETEPILVNTVTGE